LVEVEVPGFRIEAELGRGAMGVVYRAIQSGLERPVALKLISASGVDDAAARRFLREIRVCVDLSHPHLVKLLDAGRAGEVMYLAMELVDGVCLDRHVFRAGPLRAHQLLEALEQLADALDFVHSRGIVHRDLKPANVMVPAKGGLRLMDFGLARAEGSTVLTEAGTIVGSPRYLAPETVREGRMDARSDLYGLGFTLYEAATGTQPFRGSGLRETLKLILEEPLPPPSRIVAGLPEAVDRLILGLVEKDPRKRFESARSVLAAVRRVRGSAGFEGTSWETSRPALEALGPAEAGPATPPARATPSAPGASDRAPSDRAPSAAVLAFSDSNLTPAARLAAGPSARVTTGRWRWIAATGAVVAVAGIAAAGLVLVAPGGRSAASGADIERRRDAIRRFWGEVSRTDLKAAVRELETEVGSRRQIVGGAPREAAPARLAAARREAVALLSRKPYFAPLVDVIGFDPSARTRPEGAAAPTAPPRAAAPPAAAAAPILADASLPAAARLDAYNGFLFLSHLDDLLEHHCGVGTLFCAQEQLAAFAARAEHPGTERHELDALCRAAAPGGRCVPVHENPPEETMYLFSGLDPVTRWENYVAGPLEVEYTKRVDRKLPQVTIPGPYSQVEVLALTEYVFFLRFVRLDFVPLVTAGDADAPARTVILRPLTAPRNPEDYRVLGLRASAELLPPGRYEVRIRTFQLTGAERAGCGVLKLAARTVP
jgi:serine/threonine-protein kinase